MFVWDCIAEVVIIECLLLARDLPIVLRVFSHFEACICVCMFTRAKQPTHFERALVGGPYPSKLALCGRIPHAIGITEAWQVDERNVLRLQNSCSLKPYC